MRPVVVAGLQRLLNQHTMKPGTINKKISFMHTAIGQLHPFDKAIVMLIHLRHFAFGTLYAPALRQLA